MAKNLIQNIFSSHPDFFNCIMFFEREREGGGGGGGVTSKEKRLPPHMCLLTHNSSGEVPTTE